MIPNLEQIVCAFDFNEESRSALTLSSMLAMQSSACLDVVHIVPYLALTGGFLMMNQPMINSIYHDYTNDGDYKKALELAIMSSVPKNLKATIHILLGARIHQLLNFLRESQADLLVMGMTKKTSWWESIFLPPIPKKIISAAPCPVLVIPTDLIHGDSYAGST